MPISRSRVAQLSNFSKQRKFLNLVGERNGFIEESPRANGTPAVEDIPEYARPVTDEEILRPLNPSARIVEETSGQRRRRLKAEETARRKAEEAAEDRRMKAGRRISARSSDSGSYSHNLDSLPRSQDPTSEQRATTPVGINERTVNSESAPMPPSAVGILDDQPNAPSPVDEAESLPSYVPESNLIKIKKKWSNFVGLCRSRPPEPASAETTNTVFHECQTPPPLDQRTTHHFGDTVSPISAEGVNTGVMPHEKLNREEDKSQEAIAHEMRLSIRPGVDFPMAFEKLQEEAESSEVGHKCVVAWCFDQQPLLNISSGTVQSAKRKYGKRQVVLSYEGIYGHKEGNGFTGVLPPQTSTRIYKIIWLRTGGLAKTEKSKADDRKTTSTQPKVNHTENDLDFEPLPTSKSIEAEFIPCVISIYRELMRDYADSSYEYRNKVWNRVLSAMKFSLTTIREASKKRRRRRPFPEPLSHNVEQNEDSKVNRAIKKATRLILEGCVTKATKALDQENQTSILSDQEILKKLRDLHPNSESSIQQPADAPLIAFISTQELRTGGRRLAKGAAPGPSGTTDCIVRLLLDDEICCSALCHMIADLINGLLSTEVMSRLKRARLIAIEKIGGGIRPVAVGELFLKLAEVVMLQRYEHTLGPLFEPWQFGVQTRSGCERIIHNLQELHSQGKAILSIDLKNAFNSPRRDEMARSLLSYATLRPFQRLFFAEYSSKSELLYYGKDGKLCGIVESACGVRQGSPLSTLIFCAFLQSVLATISLEFPDIKICAYIDDINLVSNDAGMLSKAFFRIWDLLDERNVQLSNDKCIWFQGTRGTEIPEEI